MVVGVSSFDLGLDPYLSVNKAQYMGSTEEDSIGKTYNVDAVSSDISLWVTTRTKFLLLSGDFLFLSTLLAYLTISRGCFLFLLYSFNILLNLSINID